MEIFQVYQRQLFQRIPVSDIRFISKQQITVSDGESGYEVVLYFEDGNEMSIDRHSEFAEAIEMKRSATD